jgi:Holliday junction DNA helicase RuvB
VANARLHWARIYSAAKADGAITEQTAHAALDMAQVDADGLDKNDRRYLEVLIDAFGGGPTGADALAATMNIAGDTISDEIEPYLLREQFIIRSPRGRIALPRAFTLLGRTPPKKPEEKAGPTLFE